MRLTKNGNLLTSIQKYFFNQNFLETSSSGTSVFVRVSKNAQDALNLLNADYFLRYLHQDPKAASFFVRRIGIKEIKGKVALETEGSLIGSLDDFKNTFVDKNSISLDQIAMIIKWVVAALSFLQKEGISYPNLTAKKIIFLENGIKLDSFNGSDFQEEASLQDDHTSILSLAHIIKELFLRPKGTDFSFFKDLLKNQSLPELICRKAKKREEIPQKADEFSNLLVKMLDPNSTISFEEILSDPFLKEIEVPDPSPSISKTLCLKGPFTNRLELWRGGFGIVYSVDLEDEEGRITGKYAIKEADLQSDENAVQSILEENRILRFLERAPQSGSYIVKREGLFRDSEQVSLILELASSDLSEYRRRKRDFSLEDARKIGKHLFKALEFLSEHKVIHSDIKPRNILIRRNGIPVLADFGASIFQEKACHFFHKPVDTLFYRSPERCLAISFTTAVDIWSLTTTLITTLLDRCPFILKDNESLMQIHEARLGKYPVSLIEKATAKKQKAYQKIAPSSSHMSLSEFIKSNYGECDGIESFIGFVNKGLALDPDQRPSAEDLLKEPFLE